MGYTDPTTVHDPATGDAAPAAWGDAVNADLNYLYGNGRHLIAKTTLATSAASISSGTLPAVANGTALIVKYRAQHTTTTAQDILCRFNSDTGANYVRQYVLGNDTTVSGDAVAAATSFLFGTCGNESTSRWSIGELLLPNYLGSSHKTGLAQTFDPRNLTAPLLVHFGLHWANTAQITSVSIAVGAGGFATGSYLEVWAEAYNP